MNSNSVLLEKVKSGDKTAEEELVEQNMGLVINAAKRFLNRGCDFEELTQIGAIGLIKAVKRFDDAYGVCFSTYAVPVIIGEIRRFLRDDNIIKISRTVKERAIKGRQAEEQLRRELKREPTINEVSETAGVSPEDLVEAFEAAAVPESIYYENDDSGQSERLRAPDSENDIINKVLISELLSHLDARERQIIVLRYFKEKTQAQIAEIIGVSQVQISRIEKNVLKKLRGYAT